MCMQPGRLYSSKGRSSLSDKFCGGTLFVDLSSFHIWLKHQVSLSASDTIQAKILFEQFALNTGVSIQRYHADNGVFKSQAFLEELTKKCQTLTFSGIGAPHQNGVAERAIGVTQQMAQTVMLHTAMHSPEGVIIADLFTAKYKKM